MKLKLYTNNNRSNSKDFLIRFLDQLAIDILQIEVCISNN